MSRLIRIYIVHKGACIWFGLEGCKGCIIFLFSFFFFFFLQKFKKKKKKKKKKKMYFFLFFFCKKKKKRKKEKKMCFFVNLYVPKYTHVRQKFGLFKRDSGNLTIISNQYTQFQSSSSYIY